MDIPFQERMFFVGANASGKSNLLDVFRFLRDLAKHGGGLQTAVLDRGGISKLRCLNARKDSAIKIRVELSESSKPDPLWTYELVFKNLPRKKDFVMVESEKVWKLGKLIVDRPNSDDELDSIRLTQTFLEQVNTNREFRSLVDYFSRISYFHLVPQLLRYPQLLQALDAAAEPFGYGFLEHLASVPEKTRNMRLRKIGNLLKILVPQLKDFTYVVENTKPHLQATYSHWRPHAGKQDEREFSDGTLRIVALLWTLWEQNQNLVLLEEPELSLHTAVVEKLPLLFSRIPSLKKSAKFQLLVTTHSEALLSDPSVPLDEIVLLEPSDSGTKCEIAGDKEELCALLHGGMTPGEIVFASTRPQKMNNLEQPLLALMEDDENGSANSD